MAEERPIERLFNCIKAFQALITFISSTQIGSLATAERQEEERGARLDRWDINLLGG